MVIEKWFMQDLQKPVVVHHLDGSLFSHNGNGNRIGVELYNGGEPLESITWTVSGYVVVSDGTTVPCTGSKSGNKASILIPAAAYVPGNVFVSIFVTDDTTVTTVAAMQSVVMQTRTGTQVDPGTVVADWTQTINAAMQEVETAAEDLAGIIATPYASLTYPVPLGKYTYYNGGLYRCITPIATSETWTAAHWTAVKLGDDVSNLKSATDDLTDCAQLGLIPYACNKTNTNILTVAQNGNEVTLNGTSSASASQAQTKVIITGDIYSWNSTSAPSRAIIFPVRLTSGHSYKLKASIVSGTRDAGSASGNLVFRIFDRNSTRYVNMTIAITETTAEEVFIASAEPIQIIMYVTRTMTVTDLVVRVELSDVTTEVELDGKQDTLTFDDAPVQDSTNPVTSGGIFASTKTQIERATDVKFLEYTYGYNIELGGVGSVVDFDNPHESSIAAYAVGTVVPYQVVKCKLTGGSSSYRAYAFLDADNKIIKKATTNNTNHEYTLTAPPNSAKIIINALIGYNHWAVVLPADSNTDNKPWSGLYVSLLGDSISSLQGYVPAGNQTYYGPSKGSEYQRSIYEPEQMWWYQIISTLGGTPLIIDAWSGSSVTQGGGDTGTVAMCDVSRCQNLHAWVQTTVDDPEAVEVTADNIGSMRTSPFLPSYTPAVGDYAKRINPDIIFSTGGTNDWTYATTAESIGTYDGHTSLPNPEGDAPAVTTFREAYATMLCRIQKTYPFALTICNTGFFNMRPYTTKYQGNKNNESGLTIQDYSKAIREIAAIRACPVVEVWESGFNKYNYYDTFAGDFSTSTTHPNPLGHQMIAECAIPAYRDVCAGYVKWLRTRNEEE